MKRKRQEKEEEKETLSREITFAFIFLFFQKTQVLIRVFSASFSCLFTSKWGNWKDEQLEWWAFLVCAIHGLARKTLSSSWKWNRLGAGIKEKIQVEFRKPVSKMHKRKFDIFKRFHHFIISFFLLLFFPLFNPTGSLTFCVINQPNKQALACLLFSKCRQIKCRGLRE